MKKLLFILVALVFTTSNAQSISLSETTSDSAASAFLSLEQTSTQQFAKVEWLPDYLTKNTKRVNDGGKNPCDGLTDHAAPYGCQKTYANCPSKCQTPKGDNCGIRTEVLIPRNASCSQNFADCGSKCEAWGCNSGYMKNGNTCIDACQYSVPLVDCLTNCKKAGSNSCTTQKGVTYYESCGISNCKPGQSCNAAGRCVDDCTYTTTKEFCTSECKTVSANSCTRNGTTYYSSCGNSTCGNEQRCSSGTCVNNCTYNQTSATCNDQCKDVGTTTCTRSGTTYYESCGATRGSKDCTGAIGCVTTQVEVSNCKGCNGQTLYTCREKTCVERGFKLLKDFVKPIPTCKNCVGKYYYNGFPIIDKNPNFPVIDGDLTVDKGLISGGVTKDNFSKADEPSIFSKIAGLFTIKNAHALIEMEYEKPIVGGCGNGGLCVANCKNGETLVNGQCVGTIIKCLAGQTLVDGKCVGEIAGGGVVGGGDNVVEMITEIRYDFIVSSTCSSDTSYLKGEWVQSENCKDLGFKLLDDFAKPVPTCANCVGEYYYNGKQVPGSTGKISKIEEPSIFSKFAELFTIKSAHAVLPPLGCPKDHVMVKGKCVLLSEKKDDWPTIIECPEGQVEVNGKCLISKDFVDGDLVVGGGSGGGMEPVCPEGQILLNGKCVSLAGGGGVIGGGGMEVTRAIRYDFIASSTCPSDSNYLKGMWVENTTEVCTGCIGYNLTKCPGADSCSTCTDSCGNKKYKTLEVVAPPLNPCPTDYMPGPCLATQCPYGGISSTINGQLCHKCCTAGQKGCEFCLKEAVDVPVKP